MKNRKLIRKVDHDYNWHGSYFITICTGSKVHYFGAIKDLEIQLSNLGQIAFKCWKELEDHFKDIEIDEFIVMPNHVHGILHLLPDERFDDISGKLDDSISNLNVGKRHAFSLRNANVVKRMHERLPNIIGSYKSSVTRIIRQDLNNYDFSWQTSYHDRIIRDEHEMSLIRQYIHNNSINWHKDNYNPERVLSKSFNNKPISGKMI
jgi:putative transposase